MRTVRVEVTAEDIAAGVKFACEHCPIARALLRATGSPRAWVDTDWSAVGNWEGQMAPPEIRVRTTPSMRRFMDQFDHSQPVDPFSFDLELP